MIEEELEGVDFSVTNSDKQDLIRSLAHQKFQLAVDITMGLGTGGKPEIAEEAALAKQEQIKAALQGKKIVLLLAGMGGGMGTGAIPVYTRIAKNLGAMTIAIITTPFNFEGKQRMKRAEEGIQKLRKHIDVLVRLPNQDLISTVPETMSLQKSFELINKEIYECILQLKKLSLSSAVTINQIRSLFSQRTIESSITMEILS